LNAEARSPAMTSDEQLMLEFQQGSREAFGELFGRYRERIYGFFRRRLNHAARAEELAQETFLAVLRAAARYEPRALFRTYLYGIAMNLLAAERRKAGREESQAAEAADPPATGSNPDPRARGNRADGRRTKGNREPGVICHRTGANPGRIRSSGTNNPGFGRIRIRNAAVEGFHSLRDSALGLALFLLSYGPPLLFWGALLFWPARYAWRRIWAGVQA
jgi:RNA polymerase sigma factor (sigma-70 family)